jgi:MOSC domain-containing protein YiiM
MSPIHIVSLNIGISAPLFIGANAVRESVQSAIRKTPVSTQAKPLPVDIKPLGLAGDQQSDLSVHGGLDKAVYVYPVEHYAFWNTVSEQAGQKTPLPHGKMGENITLSGLTERNTFVGDLLYAGSVILRVESPRQPCFKFNAALNIKHAVKMMVQSGFCGFYCSVVQPGITTAGDKVAIHHGDQVLSIEQRFAIQNRNRQKDLF